MSNSSSQSDFQNRLCAPLVLVQDRLDFRKAAALTNYLSFDTALLPENQPGVRDHAVSGGLNTPAGAAFRLGRYPAIVLALDCRIPGAHIYARVGRGAVAVFDVKDNDALHRILNEWADIVPAHFDTYPLIDADAAKRMLAAQSGTSHG